MNKSEWAAWVQAVGSIGAILAAIGLAQHQYKLLAAREHERQRQAQLQFSNTVLSIAAYAQRAISTAPFQTDDEVAADRYFREGGLDYGHLDQCLEALKAIPLVQLSTGEGAIAVISIIASVENCIQWFGQADHLYVNPNSGDWKVPIDQAHRELRKIEVATAELTALRDSFLAGE
ncbi:MAG: hypothetical protein JO171_15275 [Paludibacterium sp.]|uniref:hypothetical protein n=1 Tax=Paludibacterium sp. TaxID=1917523 RepID=UPI0025D80C9D|nr:hypothetical protein [Paludibacterium sp.]MBV8048510.1 hypothetical protein [Paludibacterium sp.]